MLKLLLLVLLVVVVWYVVRTSRSGALGSSAPVRFQPVDQLPEATRHAIDVELAADRTVSAVALYREATGAGPKEARTALDTYRWRQGGTTS